VARTTSLGMTGRTAIEDDSGEGQGEEEEGDGDQGMGDRTACGDEDSGTVGWWQGSARCGGSGGTGDSEDLGDGAGGGDHRDVVLAGWETGGGCPLEDHHSIVVRGLCWQRDGVGVDLSCDFFTGYESCADEREVWTTLRHLDRQYGRSSRR